MANAQAYADANPAAVRQILPTYTKVTAQAAQHLVLNYFPATLSAAQLQRVADLMRSGGLEEIARSAGMQKPDGWFHVRGQRSRLRGGRGPWAGRWPRGAAGIAAFLLLVEVAAGPA